MNYPLGEELPRLVLGDATPEQLKLEELATEMRGLWRSMTRDAACRPHGAENPLRQQYWVLSLLAAGPRRMSDLAEATFTSQASLTGIIDRMEERGLVERLRIAEDRRVVVVGLTESGMRETERVHTDKIARLGSLLAPLSEDEREQLLALLQKINHAGQTEPVCEENHPNADA